jgi:hypothetical protein
LAETSHHCTTFTDFLLFAFALLNFLQVRVRGFHHVRSSADDQAQRYGGDQETDETKEIGDRRGEWVISKRELYAGVTGYSYTGLYPQQ